MKFTVVFAAVCLAALPAVRSEPDDGPPAPKELHVAIDDMLSERSSPEALETAIKHARELGATEQSVLEARFLFHVDRREDAEIAELAPTFLERRDTFDLADSEIFGVREDWLAVVEYVQAIAALRQGRKDDFKKHITEAFWLSPRQGAAFAPHIERLRLDEAMRSMKLDFSLSFQQLDGTTTDLRSILGENKALLIHFFSPWSRECEETLDDFESAARALIKAGIPVVTLIGEAGAESIKDTRAILDARPSPSPGAWAMDNPSDPLARKLRVQSAPTMVLVAPDGKILFNGHPSEDRLWKTAAGVAPDFDRPRSNAADH